MTPECQNKTEYKKIIQFFNSSIFFTHSSGILISRKRIRIRIFWKWESLFFLPIFINAAEHNCCVCVCVSVKMTIFSFSSQEKKWVIRLLVGYHFVCLAIIRENGYGFFSGFFFCVWDSFFSLAVFFRCCNVVDDDIWWFDINQSSKLKKNENFDTNMKSVCKKR